MPRKKAEQGALFTEAPKAEVSVEQRPTRELWRFIDYYNKNVRKHSQAETVGVIRQIQRLVEKGTTLESIFRALENYAQDEWRKAQDARYSKHIRSFFTKEMIEEWQTPRPAPHKVRQDVFTFAPSSRPAPVQVTPSSAEYESYDL